MANLWSGKIEDTGLYQNLETATGLTFTEGNTYAIQIENGGAHIREGSTGRGFSVYDSKIISFTKSADDIYIEPMSDSCFVNIAG